MADSNGAPRRVSMAYILGFSDKPYKEVKPPAPPQPRKPNQPTTIIPSPGRIMEWTASDGRKGRLTGTGKPRLTSASLAKVPSETRSTKAASRAKSTSKNATPEKAAANADDPWSGNAWDTPVEDDATKSNSKKNDEWVVDNSGGGNNDPFANTWENTGDTSGGNNKRDEKEGETTAAGDIPTAPAEPPAGESNGVVDEDVNKEDASGDWTKEQDEKLIQMKTENLKSWADIGEGIGGKTKQDCVDRFKVIKPDGWKPNETKKGDGSKKDKKKGNKPDHNHEKNKQGGNKKEDKKEGDTGDNKDKSVDPSNAWNAAPEATAGGTADWDNVGWGNTGADTGAQDKKDKWNLGPAAGGGDGANDAWNSTGGGNWNETTNNNETNNSGGGVDDLWTNTTPAQKAPSNKAPSQPGSQPNASNNNTAQPAAAARPLELEVKPDDTFSANDLRLIARILQQDCSMVWNRVSWRFRDKTGRTLHPDEFEKKITGRLESKGSEKGERRR